MSPTPWRGGRFAALAAAVIGAALGGKAFAADLEYDEPRRDRWSSAYEDPRYNDLYGRDPAPPRVYVERPPARPYGFDRLPVPSEPIYRDHPYPAPRYAERPRHHAYSARPGCVSKDAARDQLESAGWMDFHDPQIADRDTAYVKARRPSGRLFQLQVDRCSGDVMSATPLEPRYRPYAERWPWRPPHTY